MGIVSEQSGTRIGNRERPSLLGEEIQGLSVLRE